MKFKQFKQFKQFLEESKFTTVDSITVDGNFIKAKISKDQYNDLMQLEINASKTLPGLKSAESFKTDENEDNWNNIEKQWKSIALKCSGNIEQLVKKFEKNLSKEIDKLSAELSEIPKIK